ncbi:MAG: AbrB/MazE/SpoVT family DNA-binding domain-containing protein [Thermomicrobiales bacterium]
MIEARVRKQGNSLVVTIPKEDAEHYHIAEGDQIAFVPNKVETRYVLRPELQKIADEILEEYKDVFEYLADK